MSLRRHTVAETPSYLRDLESSGLGEDGRRAIVTAVAADPRRGSEIKGSSGLRKVNVAGTGAWRVIVAYLGPGLPAYLVGLLPKAERAKLDGVDLAVLDASMNVLRRACRRRPT